MSASFSALFPLVFYPNDLSRFVFMCFILHWFSFAFFPDILLLNMEDGNTPSFRNIVFSSILESRTMEEVHERSNSECFTSSSDPFRA
jgi:hypothetical protein